MKRTMKKLFYLLSKEYREAYNDGWNDHKQRPQCESEVFGKQQSLLSKLNLLEGNVNKNRVEDLCEQKPIQNEYGIKNPIEIPFGSDSELLEETITIPDGCVTTIEGNKIHIKRKTSTPEKQNTEEYTIHELKDDEGERIRKALIHSISEQDGFLTAIDGISVKDVISWLEKQGEHKKFRDLIQVGDKVTRNVAGDLVNISQFERIVKPRAVKNNK